MKKTTTLLLSLGMLASTSAVIYGAIAEETKNSVYLPHNSWVVAELEEKIANLPKEAKKQFKGDVPQYIVDAYVSNNAQRYQSELNKLQSRYN